MKSNTQESNLSQETLQNNNLSSKDSNQTPTEEQIKSQARNKMISEIRDNCLGVYVVGSPTLYYASIFCGTYTTSGK